MERDFKKLLILSKGPFTVRVRWKISPHGIRRITVFTPISMSVVVSVRNRVQITQIQSESFLDTENEKIFPVFHGTKNFTRLGKIEKFKVFLFPVYGTENLWFSLELEPQMISIPTSTDSPNSESGQKQLFFKSHEVANFTSPELWISDNQQKMRKKKNLEKKIKLKLAEFISTELEENEFFFSFFV